MSTELIVEIADLAWSLTKAQLCEDPQHDDDVEASLLAIIRNGIQAYEEHTGLEFQGKSD